jgi:hypothetical protein
LHSAVGYRELSAKTCSKRDARSSAASSSAIERACSTTQGQPSRTGERAHTNAIAGNSNT